MKKCTQFFFFNAYILLSNSVGFVSKTMDTSLQCGTNENYFYFCKIFWSKINSSCRAFSLQNSMEERWKAFVEICK